MVKIIANCKVNPTFSLSCKLPVLFYPVIIRENLLRRRKSLICRIAILPLIFLPLTLWCAKREQMKRLDKGKIEFSNSTGNIRIMMYNSIYHFMLVIFSTSIHQTN